MSAVQARGQKTQQKIIQTAFDLFHKQGIHATSVDEILAKSKTGKSQFYHYFKSKDDVIHAVVKGFCEKLCNKEIPLQWNITTWDELKNWFEFFIQCQKSMGCARGCPMGLIGYELTEGQEAIRKDISHAFDVTKEPLIKFFSALKTKGKLKASADPQALAEFCYLVMQGGLIVSKIQKDTAGFEHSVRHLLSYLKSLQK
jgi:TetR/AcrR family transcriptional regulator, transcriptional repressor for nem operon